MWFSTSSGKIELRLTKAQAASGSHQGQCDDDVAELMRQPSIARQLAKLSPELVRRELREYGAWNDEELVDHDLNLSRLLWLACGDIVEARS
jgi:hypothetical protein